MATLCEEWQPGYWHGRLDWLLALFLTSQREMYGSAAILVAHVPSEVAAVPVCAASEGALALEILAITVVGYC